MTTHIALLRAVNLGPHNKISMADLRALLADAGMSEVRTLLQSGNAVFRARSARSGPIEAVIEKALHTTLRLDTDVMVRSVDEWHALVAANPFADAAATDPSHLLAVVLKKAPEAGADAMLQRSITGREQIRVVGRCAYIVYRTASANRN